MGIIDVFAANLTQLMQSAARRGDTSRATPTALDEEHGIPKSTIYRWLGARRAGAVKGRTAICIDDLERVGGVFGIAAWALLCEDFNAEDPPAEALTKAEAALAPYVRQVLPVLTKQREAAEDEHRGHTAGHSGGDSGGGHAGGRKKFSGSDSTSDGGATTVAVRKRHPRARKRAR